MYLLLLESSGLHVEYYWFNYRTIVIVGNVLLQHAHTSLVEWTTILTRYMITVKYYWILNSNCIIRCSYFILNITKYWLISTMNSIFTFPHLDIRVAKVGVASTNYVAQKNLHVYKEALYHHCWFMLFFDYFFYNNEFDVFMHETNFLCFLHKIWNPVKYSTWAQVDICFNARCWFDLFIHDTIHKSWCNHNS